MCEGEEDGAVVIAASIAASIAVSIAVSKCDECDDVEHIKRGSPIAACGMRLLVPTSCKFNKHAQLCRS